MYIFLVIQAFTVILSQLSTCTCIYIYQVAFLKLHVSQYFNRLSRAARTVLRTCLKRYIHVMYASTARSRFVTCTCTCSIHVYAYMYMYNVHMYNVYLYVNYICITTCIYNVATFAYILYVHVTVHVYICTGNCRGVQSEK
jgi:hypothetical protein